jgi:signal transduction histidine kinase/AmiR/NasT family two-component response regulator
LPSTPALPLHPLFRPLRHFLLIFVLAIVLPGTLLALTLTWWSMHQLVEDQEKEAQRVATSAAESIGNRIDTLHAGIAVLSHLPLVKEHFADFYRVAKGFSTLAGYQVTLGDTEGNQFLSTRLPFGTQPPRREAMDSVRKAVASGKPQVSDVFMGRMLGNYVVTMDAPIASPEGMRVITFSIDAKAIVDMLFHTALPEGWLVALVDGRGTFIARSVDQDKWIGKPTRPELIDAIRKGGSGMIYNKSVEGFPILNVFHRVPDTDWTVLVGIPESVLYAPVAGPRMTLAALIIGAALLTGLLTWLFYRRLDYATARLLGVARSPLGADGTSAGGNSFAEFEAIELALRRAATVLELERSKLAAAFDNTSVGFLLCNAQGRDVSMNATALRLFDDGSNEEARRTNEERIADWELRDGQGRLIAFDERPLARATRGDFVQGIELQLRHAGSGREWICNVTNSAVRNRAGGVMFIVQTMFDVTESKRLQRILELRNTELANATRVAEDANLAKSDFLSSMSHDLRSPLNAILGFAQLIEAGTPPPTPLQQKNLAQILKGGWYLLDLVNEILDLAAIESGKLSLSYEPVLLIDVMNECRDMVEPMAQKRSVRLNFAPFDRTWFVAADRTRLKQVLINLLSNAIKYNRAGGSVDVRCTIGSLDRVRVDVQDSGIGLSPENLSQLFQPFSRFGQEKSTEEGTGLGLSLSKHLVELMGGTIGVESAIDAGSLFWFELMRGMPPRSVSEVSAPAGPVMQTLGTAATCTLLYVEDNPANLELVERILDGYPHLRMLSAPDGEKGVALACAQLPDVILMDINLPGISGVEAMQILQGNPATAHIPVIALTANAMRRDLAQGRKAGFFAYLTKPFKIDDFKTILDDALKLSETRSRRHAGTGDQAGLAAGVLKAAP